MLSASDATPGEDSGPTELDLSAGEQALLLRTGSGSLLQYLPDRAFENLLVVSAGPQPAEIEAVIRRRSLSPRSVGVVPISGFDLGYDGPLWTTARVSANDLTGISIRVSQGFEHLNPGRGWLVFDSVTTLLMYADADRVFRLVDWLVRQCRSNEVTGVWSVQGGVVVEQELARYRGLCSSVHELD
jgi:hypothetical protein